MSFDTVTTSSGSSTSSYLYGDLLFGGTAPVEQISTSSSGVVVTYLVSTQSGVQGVNSASGSSVEQLSYSLYGVPTITSRTAVTPFGFQGSYSDPTGLLYLINRYYDPSTDQFVSIDPLLDQTGQPYVFTNDSPLNATDPLGQCWFACGVWHDVTKAAKDVGHFVNKYKVAIALTAVTAVALVATGGVAGALVVEGASAWGTLTATAEVAETGTEASGFGELLGTGIEKLSAITDLGVTAVKTTLVLTVPVASGVAAYHEAVVARKTASKRKK